MRQLIRFESLCGYVAGFDVFQRSTMSVTDWTRDKLEKHLALIMDQVNILHSVWCNNHHLRGIEHLGEMYFQPLSRMKIDVDHHVLSWCDVKIALSNVEGMIN